MTPEVSLAAAVAALILLVVVVVNWMRMRRLVLQRVRTAIARLNGPDSDLGHLERTLDQLDRAVDSAVVGGGDADAAETRLERALGAIPDGVVILDEQANVVFRNEPAAAFLDARHGEAVAEQAINELGAAALDGESSERTVDLFGPPRRTLVMTADPLDDGSRSIGAFVIIDDVTERRRLEAIRRDFVTNISHELKTPVGGLSVLAETLLDEDDQEITRRLAGRMYYEAQRVARTIDDLLELSRIEAGEDQQPQAPILVHLFMAEAVERATAAAEMRGVTIDFQEPPHHLAVPGDRRQLTSALFNLLDNAIKYSEQGATVKLSAIPAGDTVEIAVADRGIGIPRRDLERVFERFYRVDRARSRDTGGTGLGLAIVRHVVANHAGEVKVSSREGEGSTFTLRLPAGSGPATQSSGRG